MAKDDRGAPYLRLIDRLRGGSEAGGADERSQTLQLLKSIAAERELRSRFFEPSFVVDPAWSILVELAMGELEGRKLTTVALTKGAGGANRRWIELLAELGYCRASPEADPPTAWRLSARGWNEMRRFLDAYAALRSAETKN